jgi:hypothetical protein
VKPTQLFLPLNGIRDGWRKLEHSNQWSEQTANNSLISTNIAALPFSTNCLTT